MIWARCDFNSAPPGRREAQTEIMRAAGNAQSDPRYGARLVDQSLATLLNVHMTSDWQLRRDLTRIGRLIYERGLVAGTDGNISARANGDRLLISPSGSCLGML